MRVARKLAKRRAGLWRSQLGWIKRFSGAFAQCLGSELFQFRISTLFGDDALPFLIAGLLLEKAGEIHNLARLVFWQATENLNEFFGNCRHADRLALCIVTSKWSHHQRRVPILPHRLVTET